MFPKARQDQILAEKVGNELAVYDQAWHRARRLNRTAALVWRNCDGQRTVAELAALLQQELHQESDEDLVLMTLDRLEKAKLLEDVVERSTQDRRFSRRQVVRKASLVGAMALFLPVVITLTAPTARANASGGEPPPNTGTGS